MKVAIAFFMFALVFGVLERIYPLHRQQKIFRKQWFTDVAHFFINHFLVNLGTYLLAVILYILLFPLVPSAFHIAVRSQPPLIQFIEAFVTAQFIFYWLHRWSHTFPNWWRFHAIHHSSEQLDWLASARLHPLEGIWINIGIGIPLLLLGFTKETFGFYLIISVILGILNHANINFRFPILRWLIATPEFHHWHHSNDLIARNKNFSGFPIFDYLFGTFYLPRAKMPEQYGIDQKIPNSYWQHFLYPFQNTINSKS